MSDEQPKQRWRPLHARDSAKASAAYDEPVDGTPPHLEPSLRNWLHSYVNGDWDRLLELERLLRVHWPRGDTPTHTLAAGWEASTPDQRLSIVDATLRLLGDGFSEGDRWEREQRIEQASKLRLYLDQGGSLWRVVYGPDDNLGLYRRLPEAARDQLAAVEKIGGSSAEELIQAWHYCYKRDPQPRVAYEHAVVAVEGAAGPLLTPKDGRPSLGKVIGHLEDSPGRYTVAALDGRETASQATLLSMLQLVAYNQPRHAGHGGTARQDVSHDSAQAVVAVAITLVQWFSSGLVRRLDS